MRLITRKYFVHKINFEILVMDGLKHINCYWLIYLKSILVKKSVLDKSTIWRFLILRFIHLQERSNQSPPHDIRREFSGY